VIVTAAFVAKPGYWIAPKTNRWQVRMVGGNNYFPALTAFILAKSALLFLAFLNQ
jgi:hypothetical protein